MSPLNDFVRLQLDKLNINDVVDTVVSPHCGAVSTFIGTTRDCFEQKKVLKLEYEAYEPMAIKEMQAICERIRLQWNVEKIAIYHRLGEVPVKEASIVIAISSPHRQESLQAVQYAIDAVKSSIPIWKKEIYEKDEPQWKENKECSWATNDVKKKDSDIIHVKEQKEDILDPGLIMEYNAPIDLNNIHETVEVKCDSVNECDSHIEDFTIDPDQIQIKVDAEELNRRIESFIARKREQVNMVNAQEFCSYSGAIHDVDDDGTCARVNAILIRHKDSKSHVKVHRVFNQWSHQNTKSQVPVKSKTESSTYPPALEERLSTTEKILGVNKPVPRDVYERLKAIEDRLSFLESISPEYKDLWAIDDCDSMDSFDDKPDGKPARKRTHSSTDMDLKFNETEDRYVKKPR